MKRIPYITRLVLLSLAISIGIFAFPRNAVDLYTSEEFGVKLPIPGKLMNCNGMRSVVNHGIGIFLDPNDRQPCTEFEHRRQMGIFAFYNVIDDTRNLDGLSRWLCDYQTYLRCIAGPRDLGFSGLKTASTRIDLRDGWITISVVGQAGRFSNFSNDPFEPSVNYSVDLDTDPAHFDQDMNTFRAFLRTISISDPPT